MPRISKVKKAQQERMLKVRISPKEKSTSKNTKSSAPDTTESYEEFLKLKKLKKYYFFDSGYELPAILIGVIKRDFPLITCNHLLIGSSQIKKLLSCRLTPKDTHKIYRSRANRQFGKAAEQAARKKYPQATKSCRVSQQIPFICSAPDIVLDDRIIEVKSADIPKEINTNMIFQLLISMEIYGKTIGELHMYHTTIDDNCYKTKLLKIIKVKKEVNIFNRNFIEYSCLGYINYLRILLNILNIDLPEEKSQEGLNFLKKYCQQQPHGSFLAPTFNTNNFCFKVLPDIYFPSGKHIRPKKEIIWSNSIERYNSTANSFDNHKKNREIVKAFKKKYSQDESKTFDESCEIYSNYFKNSSKSVNINDYLEKTRTFRNRYIKPKSLKVIEIVSKEVSVSQILIDEEEYELLLTRYIPMRNIGKLLNQEIF